MGKGWRKTRGIDDQKSKVPWEAATMKQATNELTYMTMEAIYLHNKRRLF